MAEHAGHLPGPSGARRLTAAAEAWARLVLRALEAVPTSPRRLVLIFGVVALAAFAVMGSAAACGPLDFQCKADAWVEELVDGLRTTFASLTQSMIQGIFTGSLGTLGEGGWRAGISLAGRVGAIMAIVVVALAAVQIVTTLAAKQRQGILRAAIGAALAWPVASAAVWGAMQLVRVIDAISGQMIEDSHIQTLAGLTDFTMGVGVATPVTTALVALFFVFCVFIPTVLLSLIMAFRNYGIVLAIAIAPVSLMVWGFGSLREMSRGWLKVVLALILTKPVLAIALVLAAELIVQSAGELEIGGFLTGVAGLGMAVFAPFAAMGMVSGAMAVSDSNIMRGAEAGAGRFASRAAHSAGQGAKNAGHKAAETAVKSNPKTAALWHMAHGTKPGQGGGGTPAPAGSGQPTSGTRNWSLSTPKQPTSPGNQQPAPARAPGTQQGGSGSSQQQPGVQPGGGQQAQAGPTSQGPSSLPESLESTGGLGSAQGQGPWSELDQGAPASPDAGRPTGSTPAPGSDQPGGGQGREATTPSGGSPSQPSSGGMPQGSSSDGRGPQGPTPALEAQGLNGQRPSGGPKLT